MERRFARIGIHDPLSVPAGRFFRLLYGDLTAHLDSAARVNFDRALTGGTDDDLDERGLSRSRSAASVGIDRAQSAPDEYLRGLSSPDPDVRLAARLKERERRLRLISEGRAPAQLAARRRAEGEEGGSGGAD